MCTQPCANGAGISWITTCRGLPSDIRGEGHHQQILRRNRHPVRLGRGGDDFRRGEGRGVLVVPLPWARPEQKRAGQGRAPPKPQGAKFSCPHWCHHAPCEAIHSRLVARACLSGVRREAERPIALKQRSGSAHKDKRSSGRVVEGARLESVYTSKAYRGFESHLLRQLPFPAVPHQPTISLK